MTISPEIKQLNRQDFVEYLYQLQMFAKEKYSFDIFLENRVLQGSEFTDEKNKSEIDLSKNTYNKVVAEQFLTGYSEEDNIYNSL